MRTTPFISFGRNAIAIKEDATINYLNGGLQSFSKLDDLKTGHIQAPYATFEPNFWLLDGNYKFMPGDTNVHVGWMSTIQSSLVAPYNFSSPYAEIYIDFAEVHSTDGLRLYFSESTNDFADSVRIVFYNASLVTITDTTYTPTTTEFFTNAPVANFKRVLIAIQSWNKPGRFARLTGIDFDTLTTFTGTEIKTAQLVEQINPLSVETPINTLDFGLFSSAGDFSIVAPAGIYANLQYKEPIDVHQQIGNETIYIGRFYLDQWESENENEASFQASDAIALLDKSTFLGGVWHPAVGVAGAKLIDSDTLISDIMSAADLNYELDATLENIAIYGYLPISSCREALQQVAFAIGAYITCSRSNVIQIKPMELASDLVAYDYTLTAAQKGIGQPLILKPLVTSLDVVSHNYSPDNVSKNFFTGYLATGNHTIYFKEAAYGMSLSSTDGGTGTHVTLSTNWETINVLTPGTISLDSQGYRDSRTFHNVHNGLFAANANLITIDGATLISTSIAPTVAQRVYDYYQQRYLQKTKLFASLIAPGDSVLVDVQSARQLAGIVERMETDLTGGMIALTEITGVII